MTTIEPSYDLLTQHQHTMDYLQSDKQSKDFWIKYMPTSSYSEVTLPALSAWWNTFWWNLPDDPCLHKDPLKKGFYMICSMCEDAMTEQDGDGDTYMDDSPWWDPSEKLDDGDSPW